MLTARTFLVRGLLAGLIAGIVTFGVAYVIGEPSIDAAIAIEEAASAAEQPAAAPADEADSFGCFLQPSVGPSWPRPPSVAGRCRSLLWRPGW